MLAAHPITDKHAPSITAQSAESGCSHRCATTVYTHPGFASCPASALEAEGPSSGLCDARGHIPLVSSLLIAPQFFFEHHDLDTVRSSLACHYFYGPMVSYSIHQITIYYYCSLFRCSKSLRRDQQDPLRLTLCSWAR